MIEKTILKQLILNEEYSRKVLPFLKNEYFSSPSDLVIFEIIRDYITKYNRIPTQEVLRVDLEKKEVNENVYKDAKVFVESLDGELQDLKWLVDSTEEFCKEKAIYNSLFRALEIVKDPTKSKNQIPKILEDALAVSFSNNIGHDYIDDANSRFEYYHRTEDRIPFDIEILNKITKGGLPPKTFTVLLGGIHMGKTATMAHMAAANFVSGKNVLYITLEMSQEEISKRIDANLLDTSMDDIELIPKELFDKKIEYIKSKTSGRLIVREFPTAAAGAADFKLLLHELWIKKKFKPDIVYLDYLNICKSSRIRLTADVGLYLYVMTIAQEMRGLAVEGNFPLVTGTQLNREGFQNSDPGMEHQSESFGVPGIADFILGIITSEELKALNQVMFKQLKNRLGNISKNTKFVVGRDLSKMRLFDFEGKQVAEVPVFNTTQEKFDKRKVMEEFK